VSKHALATLVTSSTSSGCWLLKGQKRTERTLPRMSAGSEKDRRYLSLRRKGLGGGFDTQRDSLSTNRHGRSAHSPA
jgi:hypothetical protein